MRQLAGVGVELGIAQRLILEDHGGGLRRALRLRGKQPGQRQARNRRLNRVLGGVPRVGALPGRLSVAE